MLTTLACAQKVDVDSDPSAPFASYRTYAWAQGTPSPTPLGERRFHFAVDAQLAARGLTEVGVAPDLFRGDARDCAAAVVPDCERLRLGPRRRGGKHSAVRPWNARRGFV
jgi:hypothetical protein